MAVTTRQATVEKLQEATEALRPDEGIRFYQGRFLDELPGAAFVAITLIWIITSFAHLIWQTKM